MKLKNNSKKMLTTTVILLLTFSAFSIFSASNVTAHTPAWNIPTYAFIAVSPDPIGVGQTASVYMFLTNYYYGAAYGNDLRFHNYKLTITAPNGAVTTQTFDTIIDSTSNQHTSFVPDQVGTYNLSFTYPGEKYTSTAFIAPGSGYFGPPGPNSYTNDTFLPSSASTMLTVQSTPLPAPSSGAPLPTEFWTRPIYGENSYWYTISSNWLGTGAPNYGGWTGVGNNLFSSALGMFPGDAIGSQTSHIMWTKPLQSGGVVGGGNFNPQGQTYFDGSAYIIRYDNPIILDGKIYYNEPLSFGSGFNGGGNGPLDCVDLRTGELLWSKNIPKLSFGLIMDVQTPNEHGVCPPFLVVASGTTWMGYDADTGVALFNITNVPAFDAGKAMGPDGEYLNYVLANAGTVSNPDWRLGEWNSTKVFMPNNALAPTVTGTLDGSISTGPNTAYDWNVSLPWLNSMTSAPQLLTAKYGDGMLMMNGSYPSNGENAAIQPYVSSSPYTYFFVNLNASKGTIGSVLWWSTLQAPANNYTVMQGPVDWGNRVFTQNYKEALTWVGYSLDTGRKIWGPTVPQTALSYYGINAPGTLGGQIAYGKLYSTAGLGGLLYCYDDKTGDLLWTYGNGGAGNSTSSGFNWPYGNTPTEIQAVGNGIIYTATTAHTWLSPIYKGGLARAINATDGSEIWTVSSVTMEFSSISYAMADGFNTWFNGYDNQIYVVGRGPSTTSVSTPHSGLSWKQPLVITGSVFDTSSGTAQDEQAARFTNGVPAASDISMSDWMGYVYQQKPQPTNFTGVNVELSVLDSNGNYRQIGTATTDATGAYSYTWTPDIPGDFTAYANFAGTNSYWPSHAEDHFTVMQASSTPEPTQPLTGFATTNDIVTYFAVGVIAVIIAIAIVGMLLLRKKP